MHRPSMPIWPGDAYPLLGDVVDEKILALNVLKGYIGQHLHPDELTCSYSYTDKCASEAAWDRVSLKCRGLVVRGGKVIARAPAKFFSAGYKLMPETIVENWPTEAPEITKLQDGWLVALFEGARGPEMAHRSGLTGPISQWAGKCYRKDHKNADWPKGWTPVFMMVGKQHQKLMEYHWDRLELVTMVHNATGRELDFQTLKEWGLFNRVTVVDYLRVTKTSEVMTTRSYSKGWVCRWDLGNNPPLRVGVIDDLYTQAKLLTERVTPNGIWDLMRKGAETSPLEDFSLPYGFRTWATDWQRVIRREKQNIENAASEAFQKANGHLKNRRRVETIAEFQRVTKDREYLMPVMIAMLDERDSNAYVWQIARRVVVGQPGWKGAQDGQ